MAETDSRPATETPTEWASYFDPAWLASRREEIIEPALPIVDPHHHLWPFAGFGVAELLADLGAGHRVEATVHLDLTALGLPDDPDRPFSVHDELDGSTYTWRKANYVYLDPHLRPAHIFTFRSSES